MAEQKTIKAIIFDVDGTLYEPIPEMTEALHNYWINRISQSSKTSYTEADEQFERLKKEYKSSTRVLEVVGLGDPFTIIKQAEKFLSRYIKELIKPDKKLVNIVKKLRSHFSLYTLRNGTKVGTKFLLSRLGFENSRQAFRNGYGPFDGILPTVELGITKPHPDVFKNALKILKLEPHEILVVGDREEVDLVPAKKLGMKTVLVTWNKSREKTIADAVIPTIYNMEELV